MSSTDVNLHQPSMSRQSWESGSEDDRGHGLVDVVHLRQGCAAPHQESGPTHRGAGALALATPRFPGRLAASLARDGHTGAVGEGSWDRRGAQRSGGLLDLVGRDAQARRTTSAPSRQALRGPCRVRDAPDRIPLARIARSPPPASRELRARTGFARDRTARLSYGFSPTRAEAYAGYGADDTSRIIRTWLTRLNPLRNENEVGCGAWQLPSSRRRSLYGGSITCL